MSTMTRATGGRSCMMAAAILASAALSAQAGEEYYFNGIYNPTLSDVNKINLQPQPFDTILPAKDITYQLLSVKGEVPAHVDSIEAARLNIQLAQEKLYKGFVKAGFGLYTTPLAELYYDQGRSKSNGYGLHFRHMSSNGGIGDRGPSDYSFNNVDGFYNAYLPKHALEGRVMYDRRRVGYYGYPATDSLENLHQMPPAPPGDAIKQVYNDIGFAFRVKSLYKDSTKLAHEAGLEVHNYTNLSNSRELNVKLDALLSTRQGSETYGGTVIIDNNTYRADRDTLPELRQNGTMVGISPFVSTTDGHYLVKVGAGIFVDALGKTTFHFYPQAYAHYRLFDDILVPYVGVDGRRIRNNLRSLTRENPFIEGAPFQRNSSLMYDLYGGLRGSLSRDIGFDVRISQSRTKDRPLFLARETDYKGVRYGDQFVAVYDRVDQLDIGGELRYSHDEHINVHGGLHVFSYKKDEQAEAWNLPIYAINLGAVYDFQDKLLLKVEAQFLGRRKMARSLPAGWNDLSPAPETVDAPGFVDLYLGLEYRYTKRLGVFLDFSNLSASKYERWYNYPVQRGLVLGGATFAF
ncbi:MAG: hypothetical protein J5I62_13150 [Flavobacteriales bacterium]|nr:hypothetical protein [Flavobacteriales bacterium]MEB2343061.1 hypothetical protein [Flavobacteriia bacterium]